MSKNFLQKVIVTLVTVALLCTAFALTTFAGKIGDLTIDDAKTYEYAAVTVTKAKTADPAVVTVADTYTAYEAGATIAPGLYAVRETGSSDKGTLVLVSGVSEANNYGDILHQVNQQVKDNTTTTLSYSSKDAYTYSYYHPRVWGYTSTASIGAFKPGYWTLYEYTSHGTGRPGYVWNVAQKIYGTTSNTSILKGSAYRLTIGTYNNSQIKTLANLNARSFTYQYLNDEIIPATDFRSYKFAVSGIGAVATVIEGDIDKLQSKYVLYVINDKFEVEAYTAYATSPFTNQSFTEHTITLADLHNDSGKSITGGYIVGMQVFPYTVPAEGCTVTLTGTYQPNVAFRMFEDGYKTAYNSVSDPVVTVDGLTVSIPADKIGTVYQYSKVNGLNTAGTAISKAAYTDMTLTDGVYTATFTTGGLYYFKGTASIGTSNEILVYVEGPASERKELGTWWVSTKNPVVTLEQAMRDKMVAPQNDANFNIGKWSGSTYTWNNCDPGYNLRPLGASAASYGWHLAHLETRGNGNYDGRLDLLYDAQEAYKLDPTPDNLAALQTAVNRVIKRLTEIEAHYAYTPEEFIPTDEVNSFTYKVKYYHTYDNFAYAGTDVQTKMTLHVFNSETGKVETYTWTKDHTEPVIGYNNKNQVSVTFDFATAADNGKFLSSVNGYVVGMKIVPYTGFAASKTDPTLVTVEDGSHQWLYSLTVDPAGYDIDVPKVSAPTAADFTIENNIVTVNTSYSYKYAPADADGNYDVADLEAVVSGETVLTGGYWAFVKVSNDANHLDSDAFIFRHVAKATTPTISIDRNGYFALDTTAEGYNEEYEYEFHMVTEDTDLENLDANTWTTFNPANFQVKEAGETYLVRVKAGEAWTASDAVETKSPRAILTGISLVLDGQIGIKFEIDVKTKVAYQTAAAGRGKNDNAYNPHNWIDVVGGNYRAGGSQALNGWVYYNYATTYAAHSEHQYSVYDYANDCNYITVYVSAKDYATTKVSFSGWSPTVAKDTGNECWPSKALPNWGTTTVKTYIDLYKQYAELDPANYGGEKLALVLALEEYCMNAANYFDDEATALPAVEAVDADIANADVKGTKNGDLPEGIEFYGTSLMLEDRTQIRYYFRVDSSLYTVGEDGKTFTWNEGVVIPNADKVKTTKLISNGVIFYESAAITANKLGDVVTETFTTEDTSFTVTYSPLNYIAATYSSENVKTANLAKALYNYYKAADAYVTNVK